MVRLATGHRPAHHHWVAQLLQRLHLVLDHLLDERVQVDCEGEEDLEISYCQIFSVKLQKHLKFFFIPEFEVVYWLPVGNDDEVDQFQKFTGPFQAMAPSPFELESPTALGRKPVSNYYEEYAANHLGKREGVFKFFLTVDIEGEPACPVRPLFSYVCPASQVVPVEINPKGLEEPPHHVDDVHQSPHTPGVHIREVVVGEEHLVHLQRPRGPRDLVEVAGQTVGQTLRPDHLLLLAPPEAALVFHTLEGELPH